MADARVLLGDCIATMAALEAESIDALVTDPPYGIEFMGRDWDKFIPHDEVEMSPRWANAERGDPAETHWGDGEAPKYGKLPTFGGKRTSFQCQNCGKRDAFRNPHKCGDATDWRVVPSYAGASPDVLAFEQFSKAWATEAYRVLKPGGHLLAFGATRMYHRLAAGIEDAGFEIRDSLHWIYGSGFPKSLDVSLAIDNRAGEKRADRGEHVRGNNTVLNPTYHTAEKGTPVTEDAQRWKGWGTALKPAHEPIVMARKPLSGTVAETVLAHGTGALNIDASRPGGEPGSHAVERPKTPTGGATDFPASATVREPVEGGRWPANIILAHLPDCEGSGPTHTEVLCAPGCPVAELNESSGHSQSPSGPIVYDRPSMPATTRMANPASGENRTKQVAMGYGDAGGAARFFYIAKPRRRERIGGTIRNLHPCLAPDSLVITEGGYREIASVLPGDRVLADDGRFRRVVAAFPSPCDGPLYEVAVEQSNLSVRATGNHPFLIWRPERKRHAIVGGEPGWIEARDLRVGDYTMTPLATTFETQDERGADWWWMAGLWLAEGSFLTNGGGTGRYPVFSLADHEDDLVERLRVLFGEVKRYERDGHGINVVAFRPGVADDLERLCGRGARAKVLAPEVLGLDEERRRAFFDGYIAGDGAVVRGGLAAKTSSRALAPQLALLGESLGYRTCLYEFEDVRPRQINGRAITANGPYYQLFFNDGGHLTRPRFVDVHGQRFSLRRVKQVEVIAYMGEVWNLTVEGAHTFQTSVGMTHNTVKPIDLMRHLVRLVTPPGGTVLDPFLGSGTTGCAAMAEGFGFIGIENDPASHETSLARIADYAFAYERERPTTE